MYAPDAGNPQRESPLSVARKWLPWCAALIFVMTIGWTALAVWAEAAAGEQQGAANIAIAAVNRAAPAAPLIVIYAIMIVSALDLARGFAVVTERFLTEKFLEPWRERQRARIRAEVIAEAQDEARAEERRKWTEWNNRRKAAEINGEPFEEPPPGYDRMPVVPPY